MAAPQGTVKMALNGDNSWATLTLDANGNASGQFTLASPGNYSIQAQYQGQPGAYNGSQSAVAQTQAQNPVQNTSTTEVVPVTVTAGVPFSISVSVVPAP